MKSRVTKIIFTLLTLALLSAIWGFGIEPGLLTSRTEQVEWSGPPLKIVFFSDLHAGAPHINQTYIAGLVDEINSQKPDLILIGGDLTITHLIGGTPIPFETVAGQLGGLKARLGTFAVLGNHDWWNQPETIRAALENKGIQVMDNRALHLDIDGFKFWLVGIADDFTRHSDPQKTFAQITTSDPRLLFMHDPGSMHDITEPFFMALAGHLHGGQVALPGAGALVATGRGFREWSNGWTRFPTGPLFVTRGIGTSILPVRFNAPPEFVVLDLGSKTGNRQVSTK